MDDQSLAASKPRKLRTHNKSRGGCLRCKARKVKCSQTRPACSNCTKAQCPCRYPLDPGVVTVARPAILPNSNNHANQPVRIRSMPSTFSHSDLKAFHHYITVAFPRLPLGSEKAWKTDVAAMSHEFSFCMHGLIALGLSHLSFGESLSSHRTDEAKHRACAIRGVNNLIAKDHWSATENDAILVTLFALMFACSYAGDSIFDFFTLGRACGNVTKRLNEHPETSILIPGYGKTQDFVLGIKAKLKPHRIDQTPVSEARHSLDNLQCLSMNEPEQQLYGLLIKTVEMLRGSDTSAYFAFSETLQYITILPTEDFENMMNPSSPVVVALLAHVVALEALLAPLLMTADALRGGRINGRACGTCVRRLWDQCHGARPFLAWPLQFCTAAEYRFKFGDPKVVD